MIILRNLLILSAAVSAAAASSSAPPLAHELDESYTFDEYLTHHGKDYSGDPEEYNRRQRIFEKNLKKILAHNEGKMDESGELVNGGYVMGVNRFTDVDLEELPMGYNKNLHPDWSSQLMMHGEDVLAVERRRLGGLESYQVCCDASLSYILCVFCVLTDILCHPLLPFSNHPTLKWKKLQPSPKKLTGQRRVT